MREIWLNKISRKKINPTTGHRVCSAHLLSGEKTYDNNIPTIVPKRIKISETMTRITKNSQGLLSKDVSLDASYDESAIHEREEGAPTISETQLSNEEILERRVKDLEEQLEMLQGENQSLKSEIEATTFTVEKFKNNDEHFKFYTGIPNYIIFKAILDYLEPAASHVIAVVARVVVPENCLQRKSYSWY